MNLSEYQSMLEVPGFYQPRGFSPLKAVRFEPTLKSMEWEAVIKVRY